MRERKVFMNLTAHRLTDQQIEAARKELGIDEFIDAEEVVPKELLEKLRQCPADVNELMRIAYNLSQRLIEYARRNKVEVYIHLPVGSPAFMWIFTAVFPYAYCVPVFSHTKREVVEEKQQDGSVVKKSVFRFEKFIVM